MSRVITYAEQHVIDLYTKFSITGVDYTAIVH